MNGWADLQLREMLLKPLLQCQYRFRVQLEVFLLEVVFNNEELPSREVVRRVPSPESMPSGLHGHLE